MPVPPSAGTIPLEPTNGQGRHATEAAIRNAEDLARYFAHLAKDHKMDDILVLDVRGRASFADFFVIASGASRRQVRAVAEALVVQTARDEGVRPMSVEGLEASRWVLLDYGEVIVHFFDPDLRSFYDLEGLWSDAPRTEVASEASGERVLLGGARA